MGPSLDSLTLLGAYKAPLWVISDMKLSLQWCAEGGLLEFRNSPLASQFK